MSEPSVEVRELVKRYLDRALSIRDNLVFHAAYDGVPAADRRRRANVLLDQFGLLDRADSKPDMISGSRASKS